MTIDEMFKSGNDKMEKAINRHNIRNRKKVFKMLNEEVEDELARKAQQD